MHNTEEAEIGRDPLGAVRRWIEEAEACEPMDANAAALATVGADGMPSCRIVLVKAVEPEGLVFYTNYESRKGRELATRPQAALTFHWRVLDRQLRVEGQVARVEETVSDAYFASRGRGSRIGAWASRQSEPVADRVALAARVAKMEARFGTAAIPRPIFWGGFRLRPARIEFWRRGDHRLHDRLVCRAEPGGWTRQRLQP
ncbi:MAG: pyridoxamine 5'-phosphate oxidase [Alphaproteobacteria bacterium]|nr:pyridoxamine 5'-phosphate oxidase [Alphaproteobacteria bacterium]MCY4317972.1 pyridoxamine 5'-phosphate oxidase [Alphaproteobacteria bacterium]